LGRIIFKTNTMKTLFFAALLLSSTALFAQTPVKVQKETTKDEGKIFTIVEEMPQFRGGQDSLTSYLVRNLKYPLEAQKNKTKGKVYITFVVSKTGDITDVKILRGVSQQIDEEALRVIKLMPAWTPGKQNGKPVDVQYNMPINFKLD